MYFDFDGILEDVKDYIVSSIVFLELSIEPYYFDGFCLSKEQKALVIKAKNYLLQEFISPVEFKSHTETISSIIRKSFVTGEDERMYINTYNIKSFLAYLYDNQEALHNLYTVEFNKSFLFLRENAQQYLFKGD